MAKAKDTAVSIDVTKERHATSKIEVINKKVQPLIVRDGNVSAIIVLNQEQAAIASEVINKDIPPYRGLIKELWGDDRETAKELFKSLDEKFNRFDRPAIKLDRQLRDAIAKWQWQEQRKRDEAAAKLQAKIEKKNPDSVIVIQSEKVTVAGTTLAMRKGAKIVDETKLLKLVAAGKAPRSFIEFNQTEIDREARRVFDATPKDDKGKRFICDGAIEIYEEPETRKAKGF